MTIHTVNTKSPTTMIFIPLPLRFYPEWLDCVSSGQDINQPQETRRRAGGGRLLYLIMAIIQIHKLSTHMDLLLLKNDRATFPQMHA